MMGDIPLGSLSMQLRHICLEYPVAQLAEATNNFDESRRLGAGTAGTVYRAEMPDGSDAAVKVIDLAQLGGEAIVAGFEEEIAVLSKFRHPNLVVLMGWAREGARRFLIYEYFSGGDVFQRLSKCKTEQKPFLWHERLVVARAAATGLAHLHNATPHAFHRDVKSANILLGSGSAKMADFGLSCVAKTRQAKDVVCKYASGTPGYICPTYQSTHQMTEGSEVYSFGMVLLELLLNEMPACNLNGQLVYPILEAMGTPPGQVDRCIRKADVLARWPTAVSSDVAQLAISCIHADERQRPRFNEVCRTLKSIQERYPANTIPEVAEVVPLVPRAAYVPPVIQEQAPLVPTPPLAAPGGACVKPQDLAAWAARDNNAGLGAGLRALPPDRIQKASPAVLRVSGKSSSDDQPRSSSPPVGGRDDESISPPKRATAAARAAAAAKAGVPRNSSPSSSSEAWPVGADVGLEVVYVHGKDPASLPSHVRLLPIAPVVDDEGRKTLQLGRHANPQWFEAILEDPVHRNSISRIACEICWGGRERDASPTLRTLGSNLIVVGSEIVAKDQVTQLSPGSQIRFMFQLSNGSDNELADLLMLTVFALVGPEDKSTTSIGAALEAARRTDRAASLGLQAYEGSSEKLGQGYRSAAPNQATLRPPNDEPACRVWKEETWRLELVFAAGLSPEALMRIPISTRQFCFALSPSRPSVVIGRQHQMQMFEALLQNQSELLAYVSRSHLQLELTGEGHLLVTNLSQNISIAATDILTHGEAASMASGDVISFAAQAEMVPGVDSLSITTGDGVERRLAPFLSFRFVRSQGASPITSAR